MLSSYKIGTALKSIGISENKMLRGGECPPRRMNNHSIIF